MRQTDKAMENIRKKLIIGNWKMNGTSAVNVALLSRIKSGLADKSVDVGVCVPTPYLAQCLNLLAGTSIAFGAQDCSAHANGAYTGEVAASMLADVGCRHVIVGHSERRSYHQESDALVATKARAVLDSGMMPIVCVGETLAEREAGATVDVVFRQLDAVLEVLPRERLQDIVVAYEPVWAIGTGKTATPAIAQEVHAQLRARITARAPEAANTLRILYGGSMRPDSAAELLAQPDIDGGLVGAASLSAADFLSIVRAARG
jgi:triosephosphate isomerase